MTHTSELAAFAADLSVEDIPGDVRRLARVCLMDTIGVILAGHRFLEHEGDRRLDRYLQTLDGSEAATALGFHRRRPLLETAFANGSLVEVLDWQDTTMPARLHSCSGTIRAALAVGEWQGLSGTQLVRAIATGYEVGARVGIAIQPSHWYKGFQATGTVGAIGAAAAAGSLLGFDAEQMARNFGVAGHILPISSGDGVFHGATSKPLHGGMAAQAGIQAALLTRSGYGAGPLEGLPPRYHGFMNISIEEIDPTVLSRGLGKDWLSRDCSQKAYPVGLLNIGPVEVAVDLVKANDIHPEQVEKVDVTSYSDALHFTGRNYTDARSSFSDCVLSLPYSVAAAISDRTFGVRQLTSMRISDGAVHELASRVKVHVDKKMDRLYPNEWPVLVDITLKDGRHAAKRLDKVIGCPARPMTDAELSDKFLGNAGPVLGTDRAEEVLEACMNLERAEDIGELVRKLAPKKGGALSSGDSFL